LGAGSGGVASAHRGEVLAGERAAVGREQAPTRGGVVAGRAARVLPREEDRLRARAGGEEGGPHEGEQQRARLHRDPSAVGAGVAVKETFTITSSFTPTPR